MISSKLIKDAALAAGADACGISPMSRFNGAPDEMNPQFLFPEAKSCIGFVFRIPHSTHISVQYVAERVIWLVMYTWRKKVC